MVDRFSVDGLRKGYTEYIPCRYSGIPDLFLKGRIHLDVALISLTPPNKNGYCSFGVSSDFTRAMVTCAKTVIAEVNHRMPWVFGDNRINQNEIDYVIETDRPLPQVRREELSDLDRRIGRYASQLIEDGATIQLGIGRLSEAVLASLNEKRWLGVHSGLLPDGIVDLVENGVKFSEENTPIIIKAEGNATAVIMSVADEGIGIQPELHQKIFDRFFQGNGHTTGNRKGTGLGLAICRGIIEAHNGEIWINSKPGKGTTFSFSLPLS